MCNVNGIIRFAQLRMKEAVTGRCSVKKVFLEISQDSHENTCVRAFFLLKLHCGKSVQIRIFFWSVFFCIQSEYRKIQTGKNSIFRHFSHSVSGLSFATLSKKRLQHGCFSVSFVKYFKNAFFYRTPTLAASGMNLSVSLMHRYGTYLNLWKVCKNIQRSITIAKKKKIN